ncbi:hypothetical protein D3C72_1259190 [compost metagenome]
MSAVAHESLLMVEQALQPAHDLGGGVDQRAQLGRGAGRVDGREVVFGAPLDGFAELAHRPRGALHHDHGDQRDHAHQQQLAPEHVEQQLAHECFAQLQRLGHLHHGHAAAARAGHRLQHHGDTHRLAAELGVVEIDQRCIRPAVGDAPAPEGQLGEARDHLAVERRDAVEQPAAVVGLEGLERGVGHDRAQPRHVVVAFHVELLADGLGRGQQRAVVGGGGGRQALAVQAHAVDHDEHRHRHQDAEQEPRAQGRHRAPQGRPQVSARKR